MEHENGWQKLLRPVRRLFRRFEDERSDAHSVWNLTVRITPDDLDGGYVAICEDLPGCMSQGETKDEALHNIAAAIAEIVDLRLGNELASSPAVPTSNGDELRRVAHRLDS